MFDFHDSSVGSRFSAAAGTYEENASVQRELALALADMASASGNIPRILEIGCGSGLLTRLIANKFPEADILALDISKKMLEHAAEKTGGLKNVSLECLDIMDFGGRGVFDMVASSSSLHWIRPISAVTAKIHELLRPGGYIVCSIMLEGTLGELHAARRAVAPSKPPRAGLPSEQEVKNAFLSAGFVIEQSEIRKLTVKHENAHAFLKSIHDQGVTGGYPSVGRKALTRGELKKLAEHYDNAYGNASGVYASYIALLLKATREGGHDER